MAEACLSEDVSSFTTGFYDANIPTIHNPVVRYNAANPEESDEESDKERDDS